MFPGEGQFEIASVIVDGADSTSTGNVEVIAAVAGMRYIIRKLIISCTDTGATALQLGVNSGTNRVGPKLVFSGVTIYDSWVNIRLNVGEAFNLNRIVAAASGNFHVYCEYEKRK